MQFEESKVSNEARSLKQRSSSTESWRQDTQITADFWNPTAPSPSARSGQRPGSLPPVLRVHSEDEQPKEGGVSPDLFYEAPSARPQTPDLPEAQQAANPFQRQPASPIVSEKHNRTTATPLFSYQTSSDEEGGGSASRARNSRQLMRLVSKGLGGNLAAAGLPSSKERPESTGYKRAAKDKSQTTANLSTVTDTSERLRENLKAFQSNRLLSRTKK